ncbi:hypothetical protein C2S52_017722 [Perilla frutescens var. hirtella]|nr:hypothetical protein C2S52_017722 [Perilla frutescens var. hirtella]
MLLSVLLDQLWKHYWIRDELNEKESRRQGRIVDLSRGVSSEGEHSSLGYLFDSGEAPKPVAVEEERFPRCINSSTNNYIKPDGQNTSNFIAVINNKKIDGP